LFDLFPVSKDLVPESLACVHRASLGEEIGGDDGGGHLGTEGRGRVNKDDIRLDKRIHGTQKHPHP